MAYRVRSDPQTFTRTDPLSGDTITYTAAPGPLTITDKQSKTYRFQPGDNYPDWAYAIYSNPRLIETI